MNTAIAIIIVIVFVVILVVRHMQRLDLEEQTRDKIVAQRDKWRSEKIISFGQVNKIKEELVSEIDMKFKDDKEMAGLLKEIVEEWANLKIKTFQDRRSWIRRAH